MFGVDLWHVFIHTYSGYLWKMISILSRYEKTCELYIFGKICLFLSCSALRSWIVVKKEFEFLLFLFSIKYGGFFLSCETWCTTSKGTIIPFFFFNVLRYITLANTRVSESNKGVLQQENGLSYQLRNPQRLCTSQLDMMALMPC